MDPDLYAFVFMATRADPGRSCADTRAGFVRAVSRDEALGKAFRIMATTFPPADGWYTPKPPIVFQYPTHPVSDI